MTRRSPTALAAQGAVDRCRLERTKRDVADTVVALAYDRAGGRTAEAAALLGIGTRALQHRTARIVTT